MYQLVNNKGEYIGNNVNYYQINNYIFTENLKTTLNDYRYQGDFDLNTFIIDFSLEDKSILLYRLKEKDNYNKISYNRFSEKLKMTYLEDTNWSPSKSVLQIEINSTNNKVKNLFNKLGFKNRISIKNNFYQIDVLTLYKTNSNSSYYYRIYLDDNIDRLTNNQQVEVSFYIPLKRNYSVNNFKVTLEQKKGNVAEIFSNKKIDSKDRILTSVIIDQDTDTIESIITSQISLQSNEETFRSSWWYYLDGKIRFYNNDLPFGNLSKKQLVTIQWEVFHHY